MKTTKREFSLYSFYDHTGIEAHLTAMAARGWLLEKMDLWGWRYRRTEPRRLWFLAYGRRLVLLGASWEPTAEQMAAAAEKLAP